MSPSNHSSAADELFALQVAQLEHDEHYHREIARLTVHARLNHMALHFGKYVGQLVAAARVHDDDLTNRTITDTFVIALSCANILNLRLGDVVPSANETRSLDELGKLLFRAEAHSDNTSLVFLQRFAVPMGQIARACEKIDHLEAFPFRETITDGVASISKGCIISAYERGFRLPVSIKDRFAEIEPKYIFHNHAKK